MKRLDIFNIIIIIIIIVAFVGLTMVVDGVIINSPNFKNTIDYIGIIVFIDAIIFGFGAFLVDSIFE